MKENREAKVGKALSAVFFEGPINVAVEVDLKRIGDKFCDEWQM